MTFPILALFFMSFFFFELPELYALKNHNFHKNWILDFELITSNNSSFSSEVYKGWLKISIDWPN